LTLIKLNDTIIILKKRGAAVDSANDPVWMQNLDSEDLNFIRNFVMASGSLKEIAAQYEVTYPTVRLRLDRLIQKIELGEKTGEDPYITLIKNLALKEEISFEAAKQLVSEYRKKKEEVKKS